MINIRKRALSPPVILLSALTLVLVSVPAVLLAAPGPGELASVAGQVVTITGGDGTVWDPYRVSLSVPNSQLSLSLDDFVVAGSAYMYKDNTMIYDPRFSSVRLNVGVNKIYIGVVASYGTSIGMTGYVITVTREAEEPSGKEKTGDDASAEGKENQGKRVPDKEVSASDGDRPVYANTPKVPASGI